MLVLYCPMSLIRKLGSPEITTVPLPALDPTHFWDVSMFTVDKKKFIIYVNKSTFFSIVDKWADRMSLLDNFKKNMKSILLKYKVRDIYAMKFVYRYQKLVYYKRKYEVPTTSIVKIVESAMQYLSIYNEDLAADNYWQVTNYLNSLRIYELSYDIPLNHFMKNIPTSL